jgi:hypothetical protein
MQKPLPRSVGLASADLLPSSEETPLIDAMLEAEPEAAVPTEGISGIVVGWVSRADVPGQATVVAPGFQHPFSVSHRHPVGACRVGAQCALLFQDGNPGEPCFLGFLTNEVGLGQPEPVQAGPNEAGRPTRTGDAQPGPAGGVSIGWLVDIDVRGQAIVAASDSGVHRTTRFLCPVDASRIGSQCALMFASNLADAPLIVGFLHHDVGLAPAGQIAEAVSKVLVDGDQISLEAKKELLLSCGKASITLTRAGKIILRGTYILSRSSGANCIKGGSVKLN